MFEQGIVREIEGNRAVIQIQPDSPENCSACGTCSEGPEGRILEVDSTPELVVGCSVRIEVEEGGELGPAAVVFLLPVLGVLVGAVLGSMVPGWVSRSEWSGTLWALIGAMACLGVSVAVIRLYDRRYGRKRAKAVRVKVTS